MSMDFEKSIQNLRTLLAAAIVLAPFEVSAQSHTDADNYSEMSNELSAVIQALNTGQLDRASAVERLRPLAIQFTQRPEPFWDPEYFNLHVSAALLSFEVDNDFSFWAQDRIEAEILDVNLLYTNKNALFEAYEARDAGDIGKATDAVERVVESSEEILEFFLLIESDEERKRTIRSNLGEPYVFAADTYGYVLQFATGYPSDIRNQLKDRSLHFYELAEEVSDLRADLSPAAYQSFATNYGLLLSRSMRDDTAALPYLEIALEVARTTFRDEPLRIGGALSNVSVTYRALGRLKQAVDSCDEAIAILYPEQTRSVIGYTYFVRTAADCSVTYRRAGLDVRADTQISGAIAAVESGLQECIQQAIVSGRMVVSQLNSDGNSSVADQLSLAIQSAESRCTEFH